MSETKIPDHHKNQVPPVVRRAAAQAQAAHEAAYGGGPGGAPAEGAVTDPAVPPAPAAAVEGPSSSPPDLTPPAPPPPAPTTVVAPPSDEPVDWKHKFDSLKGKHDAEMARMSAEIAGLQSVIASMQVAPAPMPQGPGAAAPPAPAPVSPFSEQDKEVFGEFIEVAERAAAARFQPVIDELKAKLDSLTGNLAQVSNTVTVDKRVEAMTYLAEKVPDWAVMDRDQGFVTWLKGYDPFSMQRRQDLLDAAIAANNGPSIAAFFLEYKKLLAPSAPQSPAAAPATAQPTGPARVSLETFAAPGRGNPGTPQQPPAQGGDAQYFTQSQVKQFYASVIKGEWRNDPAGKARVEAAIHAAGQAGRIRPG